MSEIGIPLGGFHFIGIGVVEFTFFRRDLRRAGATRHGQRERAVLAMEVARVTLVHHFVDRTPALSAHAGVTTGPIPAWRSYTGEGANGRGGRLWRGG